jgi:hypothetical protein
MTSAMLMFDLMCLDIGGSSDGMVILKAARLLSAD